MFFGLFNGNAIDAKSLRKLIDEKAGVFIIDVREPHEFASGHIPGALNISVKELQSRVNELPQDLNAPIVAYCASGVRSSSAANFLRQYGYKDVRSLTGGINKWAGSGNPVA